MQLLLTDPYRADGFDSDRPITDQIAELLARLHRSCPQCGEEHVPACSSCGADLTGYLDSARVELHGPHLDVNHPREYDVWGRRLTYLERATPTDERAVLEAVEGWCVDALIEANRAHHKRTHRYLSAAEVRRYVPTATELWQAKGGSRSRLSVWVNRVMPVKAAIARVRASAAARAIAALRHEAELDDAAA
jgi:hypothetical protein